MAEGSLTLATFLKLIKLKGEGKKERWHLHTKESNDDVVAPLFFPSALRNICCSRVTVIMHSATASKLTKKAAGRRCGGGGL